jgi:dienelactone hydrolase
MRLTPAVFLAALLAALPAGAGSLPTDHALPDPAGPARLVQPGEGLHPRPLVILLPDALGEEGRSEAYVEALFARGITSLVLGLGPRNEVGSANEDPAATAEAAKQAAAWARGAAPMPAPSAIGLIGFGLGGRAALAAGQGPAVALDPGCAGLALPDWAPVLVVHGQEARDAATCRSMAEPPNATILGLAGVGHGWDLPLALAPGGALLPDPAGEGRIRAMPEPAATRKVAELVADWLAVRLAEAGAPR